MHLALTPVYLALDTHKELSGRVFDSRPKCRGFEPHRRHRVVSLSKNINPSLVLIQLRKSRPYITERLLMGRKESNLDKHITVHSSSCHVVSYPFEVVSSHFHRP